MHAMVALQVVQTQSLLPDRPQGRAAREYGNGVAGQRQADGEHGADGAGTHDGESHAAS